MGNIELIRQVEAQEIDLSGLGNYNAPDLESQTASVRISGIGNVKYFGSPEVPQEISGAGKVARLSDK